MAIRFLCPSCKQPLEIDQAWAGQSVACPYCQRVVNAPESSSWPSGNIPTASPARQAFDAPPPPAGVPESAGVARKGGSAGGALALAIIGAVLSIAAVFFWLLLLGEMVQRKVGVEALNQNPDVVRQAVQDILMAGQAPRHPFSTAALLIAAVCSLAAVALGIRGLLLPERARGMAIAACLIGGMFLTCQCLFAAGMLGIATPPG
jgi:hypothetical protein